MRPKAPSTQSPTKGSKRLAPWQSELLTSLAEKPQVRFRLLKRHERVMYGDYIENGVASFRLWEGPAGFRADSFLHNVYRPERKGRE